MCLHWANSRMGCIIPQPFESTQHGSELGEVLHADYPYLGPAGVWKVFAEEMGYKFHM